MKNFTLILLSLFIGNPIFAQKNIDSLKMIVDTDPKNIQVMSQLGIAYHDLGVDGDKKAVEKGEQLFKRILELDSTHGVGLAYLGSIHSIRARDSIMPWSKLKHAKKAIELLDHPEVTESEDLNVHLIRAMNSYEVPKFLDRLNVALEEFDFIVNHQHFSEWPSPKRAFVYLHFGKAHEKDGNDAAAEKYYQMAIDKAPGSDYAKSAADALKK